jgi:hypothetical protein
VECVPKENPEPVDDDCGVFVSSSRGQDSGTGTKGAPLKTLQHAIDQANGRPIYACAEVFTGSVTLASGSAIYGGLDCAKEWAYVGATTKSALIGEADRPALTIAKEASGAKVADFTIKASTATAAGGSSIAVVATEVSARLTQCDLVAGDGAPGADGENASSTPAQAGANGNPGRAACAAETVNGGTQVENACGMENSIGGDGGNGNKSNGGNGQPGQTGTLGKAGSGEPATVGAWSCAADGAGQGGEAGQSGTPGAGASMSDLGTLTATGFTSVAGGDGTPGKIGQGGGGGGGAKGGTIACTGNPGVGGASGGSGGAGGCGGAAGKGGQGGGASIALVSLQANLTLEDVTLKVGNGGKGGAGGDLQIGGDPGAGGAGGAKAGTLNAGCKGGDGGPGGNGGSGGGGRGGHAIGLAYSGTAPAIDMAQITLGTAGQGGPGGNNNLSSNQGADGIAAPVQEFP